eukprot:7727507-Pyramimonas_sp.AAC.1
MALRTARMATVAALGRAVGKPLTAPAIQTKMPARSRRRADRRKLQQQRRRKLLRIPPRRTHFLRRAAPMMARSSETLTELWARLWRQYL